MQDTRLHNSTNAPISQGEVGARIWGSLREHGELQTVFEAMLEEYDVEPEKLEKDLLELVGLLLEVGLVREG